MAQVRALALQRIWRTVLDSVDGTRDSSRSSGGGGEQFSLSRGRRQARLRRLCCESGVPAPLRKRVWGLLLGNGLCITNELYEVFAGYAREARRAVQTQAQEQAQIQMQAKTEAKTAKANAKAETDGRDTTPATHNARDADVNCNCDRETTSGLLLAVPRQLRGREATIRDIDVDLPRTFPLLAFLRASGKRSFFAHMRAVLDAYCMYRPDVG